LGFTDGSTLDLDIPSPSLFTNAVSDQLEAYFIFPIRTLQEVEKIHKQTHPPTPIARNPLPEPPSLKYAGTENNPTATENDTPVIFKQIQASDR